MIARFLENAPLRTYGETADSEEGGAGGGEERYIARASL